MQFQLYVYVSFQLWILHTYIFFVHVYSHLHCSLSHYLCFSYSTWPDYLTRSGICIDMCDSRCGLSFSHESNYVFGVLCDVVFGYVVLFAFDVCDFKICPPLSLSLSFLVAWDQLCFYCIVVFWHVLLLPLVFVISRCGWPLLDLALYFVLLEVNLCMIWLV